MNKKSGEHSRGIRFTALVVAFVFTATSITWSTPASALPSDAAAPVFSPIEMLAIPAELGTISKTYRGERETSNVGRSPLDVSRNDKMVILIQDAHAVIDAQENIARILGHLGKEYGIRLAALEGAKGRLEPILLRAFPDNFVKTKVMDGYEKRAELSGPEMAAVFGDETGEFQGMEDWPIYEKNYFAYLSAQEKKDGLLAQWNTAKQALDMERPKIYDEKLGEFHGVWEGYKSERTSLVDLLMYLASFQKLCTTEAGYKELPDLIASVGYEKTGKQEALAPLVRQIADQFKTKYLRGLGVKTEMNFYKRYQDFQTGQISAGQMLQYLVQVGAENGKRPKLTPALRRLLGHTETLSQIKGSALYEELERFLPEVANTLFKNKAQREMVEKYQRLFLMKNLIELELNQDELAKYQAEPEAYGALFQDASFVNDLAPALEFYKWAEERDQAFSKKIDSMMKEKNQKTAVAVAGGFHTNGLERILKEKGVAYAVVTPKIASLAGIDNYAKVMKGEVSFKEYLKTTYFDGLMRHAAKMLTEALPLSERTRTLKLWRDNVIRDLAKQGRIAEAGKYLPYIDEQLKVNGEVATVVPKRSKEEMLGIVKKELEKFKKESFAKIWRTFEFQLGIFTDGLKQLISKKELNTQTVSDLLSRSASAKPSMLAPCASMGLFPEIGILKLVANNIPDLSRITDKLTTPEQILDAVKPYAMPEANTPESALITKTAADLVQHGFNSEDILKAGEVGQVPDVVLKEPVANMLDELARLTPNQTRAAVAARLAVEMAGMIKATRDVASSPEIPGASVIVKEERTSWKYISTPLDQVSGHLMGSKGGLYEKIEKLAVDARKNGEMVKIVEWGVGDGRALIEIAKKLQSAGIHNVKLFGFGDLAFKNWENAPASVTFIRDKAENLARHFDENSIDFMYSNYGIFHMDEAAYKEHLQTLYPKMKVGSEIRHTANESKGKQEFSNYENADNISGFTLNKVAAPSRKGITLEKAVALDVFSLIKSGAETSSGDSTQIRSEVRPENITINGISYKTADLQKAFETTPRGQGQKVVSQEHMAVIASLLGVSVGDLKYMTRGGESVVYRQISTGKVIKLVGLEDVASYENLARFWQKLSEAAAGLVPKTEVSGAFIIQDPFATEIEDMGLTLARAGIYQSHQRISNKTGKPTGDPFSEKDTGLLKKLIDENLLTKKDLPAGLTKISETSAYDGAHILGKNIGLELRGDRVYAVAFDFTIDETSLLEPWIPYLNQQAKPENKPVGVLLSEFSEPVRNYLLSRIGNKPANQDTTLRTEILSESRAKGAVAQGEKFVVENFKSLAESKKFTEDEKNEMVKHIREKILEMRGRTPEFGYEQKQMTKEQIAEANKKMEQHIMAGEVEVVRQNDRIVGYAIHTIREVMGDGYLDWLVVDKDFRGQKIGVKLMDAAGQWFRERFREMKTDSEMEMTSVKIVPIHGSGSFYDYYFGNKPGVFSRPLLDEKNNQRRDEKDEPIVEDVEGSVYMADWPEPANAGVPSRSEITAEGAAVHGEQFVAENARDLVDSGILSIAEIAKQAQTLHESTVPNIPFRYAESEAAIRNGNLTVVRQNDRIVGYAIHTSSDITKAGDLKWLVVDKNFQRQKVATKLMDAAGQWFRDKNMVSVTIIPIQGAGVFYNKYFKAQEAKVFTYIDSKGKVRDKRGTVKMTNWPSSSRAEVGRRSEVRADQASAKAKVTAPGAETRFEAPQGLPPAPPEYDVLGLNPDRQSVPNESLGPTSEVLFTTEEIRQISLDTALGNLGFGKDKKGEYLQENLDAYLREGGDSNVGIDIQHGTNAETLKSQMDRIVTITDQKKLLAHGVAERKGGLFNLPGIIMAGGLRDGANRGSLSAGQAIDFGPYFILGASNEEGDWRKWEVFKTILVPENCDRDYLLRTLDDLVRQGRLPLSRRDAAEKLIKTYSEFIAENSALVDPSAEISKAREFFKKEFSLSVDADGFLKVPDDKVAALHAWRENTMIGSGIDMPSKDLFFQKSYLALSLWRQRGNQGINYLMGKGAGAEMAIQGTVRGREKNMVFPLRSHSDFELYGVADHVGPPVSFKEIFGGQERRPLMKSLESTDEVPLNILDHPDVVDLGGVEVLIPELELLFLDKWMASESTPLEMNGEKLTDAARLALTYQLYRAKERQKIQNYLKKYWTDPVLNRIKMDSFKEGARYDFETKKGNFLVYWERAIKRVYVDNQTHIDLDSIVKKIGKFMIGRNEAEAMLNGETEIALQGLARGLEEAKRKDIAMIENEPKQLDDFLDRLSRRAKETGSKDLTTPSTERRAEVHETLRLESNGEKGITAGEDIRERVKNAMGKGESFTGPMAEVIVNPSSGIPIEDHDGILNEVKDVRLKIAYQADETDMVKALSNSSRLMGKDSPSETIADIEFPGVRKDLFKLIKAAVSRGELGAELEDGGIFEKKEDGYTQIIIGSVQDGSFRVMHATGPQVPGIIAHLERLWATIHDEKTDLETKKLALAEYEWWFFQCNPYGRGGASLGDAMSMKAQIALGIQIRDEYVHQDLVALSSTLENYKANRVKEFRMQNAPRSEVRSQATDTVIIPSILRGYQLGSLEAVLRDLKTSFPDNPDLKAMTVDGLHMALETASQKAVQEILSKVDFHLLTDEGSMMDVYESFMLPGIIMKVPKGDILVKEGRRIYVPAAYTKYEKNIRPGYVLAKERLGDLFVTMILTNSVIQINGQEVGIPEAIIQEKVDVIGDILERYEENLQEAATVGAKEKSVREEMLKMEDQWIELLTRMMARGVVDGDLVNIRRNYGITPGGRIVGFDADQFTLSYSSLPYSEDVVLSKDSKSIDVKLAYFFIRENYQNLAYMGNKGMEGGKRVPDIFQEEIGTAQRKFLEQLLSRAEVREAARSENREITSAEKVDSEQPADKKPLSRRTKIMVTGVAAAATIYLGNWIAVAYVSDPARSEHKFPSSTYDVKVMSYEEFLNRTHKGEDIRYISTTGMVGRNPKTNEVVPLGYSRVNGREYGTLNTNERGKKAQATVVVLRATDGKFSLVPTEKFRASNFPPNVYPDAFQIGPVIISNGVIREEAVQFIPISGELTEVLGWDANGNVFRIDLWGSDIAGREPPSAKVVKQRLEKWKGQNGIVSAVAVDSGISALMQIGPWNNLPQIVRDFLRPQFTFVVAVPKKVPVTQAKPSGPRSESREELMTVRFLRASKAAGKAFMDWSIELAKGLAMGAVSFLPTRHGLRTFLTEMIVGVNLIGGSQEIAKPGGDYNEYKELFSFEGSARTAEQLVKLQRRPSLDPAYTSSSRSPLSYWTKTADGVAIALQDKLEELDHVLDWMNGGKKGDFSWGGRVDPETTKTEVEAAIAEIKLIIENLNLKRLREIEKVLYSYKFDNVNPETGDPTPPYVTGAFPNWGRDFGLVVIRDGERAVVSVIPTPDPTWTGEKLESPKIILTGARAEAVFGDFGFPALDLLDILMLPPDLAKYPPQNGEPVFLDERGILYNKLVSYTSVRDELQDHLIWLSYPAKEQGRKGVYELKSKGLDALVQAKIDALVKARKGVIELKSKGLDALVQAKIVELVEARKGFTGVERGVEVGAIRQAIAWLEHEINRMNESKRLLAEFRDDAGKNPVARVAKNEYEVIGRRGGDKFRYDVKVESKDVVVLIRSGKQGKASESFYGKDALAILDAAGLGEKPKVQPINEAVVDMTSGLQPLQKIVNMAPEAVASFGGDQASMSRYSKTYKDLLEMLDSVKKVADLRSVNPEIQSISQKGQDLNDLWERPQGTSVESMKELADQLVYWTQKSENAGTILEAAKHGETEFMNAASGEIQHFLNTYIFSASFGMSVLLEDIKKAESTPEKGVEADVASVWVKPTDDAMHLAKLVTVVTTPSAERTELFKQYLAATSARAEVREAPVPGEPRSETSRRYEFLMKKERLESLKLLERKIKNNEIGDIASIGDKHGESEDLERVLRSAQEAKLSGKKLHIFIHGDAFDRGKNNRRNWEILKELVKIGQESEKDPKNTGGPKIRVDLLFGNHDVMMIQAMLLVGETARKAREAWSWQGGKETLAELGEEGSRDLALWILQNFQLFSIDEKKYLHVHGGIPTDSQGNPLMTRQDLIDMKTALKKIQEQVKKEGTAAKKAEATESAQKEEKAKPKAKVTDTQILKKVKERISDETRKAIEEFFAISSDTSDKKNHHLYWVREEEWISNFATNYRANPYVTLWKRIGEQLSLWLSQKAATPRFDKSKVDRFLEELGVNGLVFAHNHIPMMWTMNDGENRIFCVAVQEGIPERNTGGHLMFNRDGIQFNALDRTPGSFKFVRRDFKKLFKADSLKSKVLSTGWDQGKFVVPLALAKNPPRSEKDKMQWRKGVQEEWIGALNEVLGIRMRLEDYQRIQKNPEIMSRLDSGIQDFLTSAVKGASLVPSDLERLNRKLLEAIFPELMVPTRSPIDLVASKEEVLFGIKEWISRLEKDLKQSAAVSVTGKRSEMRVVDSIAQFIGKYSPEAGVEFFARFAQPEGRMRLQTSGPIETEWKIQNLLVFNRAGREFSIGQIPGTHTYEIVAGYDDVDAVFPKFSDGFDFIGHTHPPKQGQPTFLPSDLDLYYVSRDFMSPEESWHFILSSFGMTRYTVEPALEVVAETQQEYDAFYKAMRLKTPEQITMAQRELLARGGIKLEFPSRFLGGRSELRQGLGRSVRSTVLSGILALTLLVGTAVQAGQKDVKGIQRILVQEKLLNAKDVEGAKIKAAVEALQKRLQENGFYNGPKDKVDGLWGRRTAAEYKRWREQSHPSVSAAPRVVRLVRDVAAAGPAGIGFNIVQRAVVERPLEPGTSASKNIIETYFNETNRVVESAKENLKNDEDFRKIFRVKKDQMTPDKIAQIADFVFKIHLHESMGFSKTEPLRRADEKTSTAFSQAMFLLGTRTALFKDPLFGKVAGKPNASMPTDWNYFLVDGPDANFNRILMTILYFSERLPSKNFSELFPKEVNLQAERWGKDYYTLNTPSAKKAFVNLAKKFEGDLGVVSRRFMNAFSESGVTRTGAQGAPLLLAKTVSRSEVRQEMGTGVAPNLRPIQDFYAGFKASASRFNWGRTIVLSLSALSSAHRDRVVDRILKFSSKDLPVERRQNPELLSIGPGLGHVEKELVRRGIKVDAIELAPNFVRELTAAGIPTREGNALDVLSEIPGQSRDMIYISGTLGYLDVGKVLAESRRVLRPGGLLIVEDSWFVSKQRSIKQIAGYVAYPTAFLTDQMEQAGFRVAGNLTIDLNEFSPFSLFFWLVLLNAIQNWFMTGRFALSRMIVAQNPGAVQAPFEAGSQELQMRGQPERPARSESRWDGSERVIFSSDFTEAQVDTIKASPGNLRFTAEGLTPYTTWSVFGTDFRAVDSLFSKAFAGSSLFDDLGKKGASPKSLFYEEIKRRAGLKPEGFLYLIDWGAGDLKAVKELSAALKKDGVSNVRIIAFGDTGNQATLRDIPSNVRFVFDRAENLPGQLSKLLPTGEKIDLIYSYQGLHFLFDDEETGSDQLMAHFKSLSPHFSKDILIAFQTQHLAEALKDPSGASDKLGRIFEKTVFVPEPRETYDCVGLRGLKPVSTSPRAEVREDDARRGTITNSKGETFEKVFGKMTSAYQRGDPRDWADNNVFGEHVKYSKELASMTLTDLGNELVKKFGREDELGEPVVESRKYLEAKEPLRAYLNFLSTGLFGNRPDNLQHHLDLPRMSLLRSVAEKKPEYGRKLDQYEMLLREVAIRWSAPDKRSEIEIINAPVKERKVTPSATAKNVAFPQKTRGTTRSEARTSQAVSEMRLDINPLVMLPRATELQMTERVLTTNLDTARAWFLKEGQKGIALERDEFDRREVELAKQFSVAVLPKLLVQFFERYGMTEALAAEISGQVTLGGIETGFVDIRAAGVRGLDTQKIQRTTNAIYDLIHKMPGFAGPMIVNQGEDSAVVIKALRNNNGEIPSLVVLYDKKHPVGMAWNSVSPVVMKFKYGERKSADALVGDVIKQRKDEPFMAFLTADLGVEQHGILSFLADFTNTANLDLKNLVCASAVLIDRIYASASPMEQELMKLNPEMIRSELRQKGIDLLALSAKNGVLVMSMEALGQEFAARTEIEKAA